VFGTLTEEEICACLSEDVEQSAQRLERAVAERRRPRQDNYTAVLYRHGG
jgi:serine/threonine protein phosphatase PrpC